MATITKKQLLSMATEFLIDRRLGIYIKFKGFGKWAVVNNWGYVLSKEIKEFIHEPIPSERSDEYIKNNRFSTIDEAYENYQKWKNIRFFLLEFSSQKGYPQVVTYSISKNDILDIYHALVSKNISTHWVEDGYNAIIAGKAIEKNKE